MKIFLSWSGSASHRAACILRDWLPSVLQALKPYVSSEDIDKGARWSTDIASELEDSSFGIICVTRENLEAPWVNFEAGALSKSLEKAQVVPFLFGVKRSEVKGPLLQFQSVVFEKEDIRKLVGSLNKRLGESERLSDKQLGKAFDVWWPQLEEELGALSKQRAGSPKKKQEGSGETYSEAILEELLELSRANQRILNNPDRLFPAKYVAEMVRETDRSKRRSILRLDRYLEEVHAEVVKLDLELEEAAREAPALRSLSEKISEFHQGLHRLMRDDERRYVSPRRIGPRQADLISWTSHEKE